MASKDSSKDGKQFICGICLENYTTPRYLPTCGHTFCEHCLLTYASNLQKQGSKLECPVCRKSHSFPENNEVTLDWIQTFPLNTVIIKMMKSLPKLSKKMADVKRNCDACKEGGEIIVAVKFCLDCKESMCESCSKCHQRFKLSSGHKLINIKELSAEARSAEYFDTFTKCPDHPEKEVDFYCKSHDAVICAVCALNNHGKPCTTIEISSHDTNAAKLGEESEKLTSHVREVIDHINLLQNSRKENKTNLKKKLKEIKDNVNQVRDQVITLMDNVVSHVTNVIKQIEIETEDETDKDMSKLSKLKEQTEQKLALLDTVEQHGSERHKFISTHLMKSQIEEIGRQISEENRLLRNVDAELIIADEITKLIKSTDVGNLVQVALNKSGCSHRLRHLGGVSNYLRDSKLVKVDEHTVFPTAPIWTCKPYFSEVAIHTDGRVILIDSCRSFACGYMCLYNPVDRNILTLKLKRPYSATPIDDTHIAVSIPNDWTVALCPTISIVTVGKELKEEKTLRVQYPPSSFVALSNSQLAVSWKNPPAFSVIDISGTDMVQMSYLDQDSNGRKFRSFDYLAVDEQRHHVIQPCNQDKAVYCFDFTGKPVFKYTDPGLTSAQGVALDMCGNVYVCQCSDPGRIHKMSPAGEPISIITQGVPSHPLAICTDKNGTGFWVTRGHYHSYEKFVYLRLEQYPGLRIQPE